MYEALDKKDNKIENQMENTHLSNPPVMNSMPVRQAMQDVRYDYVADRHTGMTGAGREVIQCRPDPPKSFPGILSGMTRHHIIPAEVLEKFWRKLKGAHEANKQQAKQQNQEGQEEPEKDLYEEIKDMLYEVYKNRTLDIILKEVDQFAAMKKENDIYNEADVFRKVLEDYELTEGEKMNDEEFERLYYRAKAYRIAVGKSGVNQEELEELSRDNEAFHKEIERYKFREKEEIDDDQLLKMFVWMPGNIVVGTSSENRKKDPGDNLDEEAMVITADQRAVSSENDSQEPANKIRELYSKILSYNQDGAGGDKESLHDLLIWHMEPSSLMVSFDGFETKQSESDEKRKERERQELQETIKRLEEEIKKMETEDGQGRLDWSAKIILLGKKQELLKYKMKQESPKTEQSKDREKSYWKEWFKIQRDKINTYNKQIEAVQDNKEGIVKERDEAIERVRKYVERHQGLLSDYMEEIKKMFGEQVLPVEMEGGFSGLFGEEESVQ